MYEKIKGKTVILRLLGLKYENIGFTIHWVIKNIVIGLLIYTMSFIVSYSIEFIILNMMGEKVSFWIFTTGFSMTGESTVYTGVWFILMCIFSTL